MNNRLNNSKGMTIVEVLVSVIIISLIMSILFTLLIQVQKTNSDSSRKSTIMISQNVITKAIERDMIEIGVKTISTCSYSDFNFSYRVIDTSEPYDCIRIEYNQSYDMSDVGYIFIYKQNEESDKPAWVMRYGRGYYGDCLVGERPTLENWKETYSVVQKLDPEVDLVINPSENEVTYSASYLSNKKYSEQKLNYGNLYIPIMDKAGFKYDIDVSFSFRLNYPTKVTSSNERVDFFCAQEIGSLICSPESSAYSDNTIAPVDEETHKYIYTCSESKASIGSVVGMNKNFISLNNVVKAGIYPSKVNSVTFHNTDDTTDTYTKGSPGIDVSYSQDGTVMMYYNKNGDLYDLHITQSGGVNVYGYSLSSMFSDFTKLKTIDFKGFTSLGINNMNSMFYNCKSLKELKNFNNLDLSNVEDVSLMFYKCSSLTTSPFRGINLDSVLYANSVFSESGLTGDFNYTTDFAAKNVITIRSLLRKTSISSFTLDYGGEEMPKLVNMGSILSDSDKNTKAVIQNVRAPKLTTMEYAFDQSSLLVEIDIINFVTPSLQTLYGLCWDSYSLNTLVFENFDTSNVTTLAYAFYNTKLTEVDLSVISLVSNTSFEYTFYNSSLITLQLGNDSTPDNYLDNLKNTSYMMNNCKSFRGFVGKKVTFKNVETAQYMFAYAGSKTIGTIDLSNLEFNNCTDFKYMFYDCYYVGVDFSGIHSKVTDKAVDFSYFMSNCYNLQYCLLTDAEFQTSVNMSYIFNNSKYLIFMDGVDLSNDEGITRYFKGEGNIVTKDGRMPFDRFTIGDGYASSLSNGFAKMTYLRGIPDGLLDGIETRTSTSFGAIFRGSFSETIPASVEISDEDYERLYKIVVPFKYFNNTGWNDNWYSYAGTTNICTIEFKGAKTTYYDGTQPSYQALTDAGADCRLEYFTFNLHDFRFMRTNGSNTDWIYFSGYNFLETKHKVRVILSDDCTIAKGQKSGNAWHLSQQYKNTIEFISNGCPSLNEKIEPTS